MLTSLGVERRRTRRRCRPASLYTTGFNALGGPNYANRIRENIGITTSGASREFDIFAAAADEVIAAFANPTRCRSTRCPGAHAVRREQPVPARAASRASSASPRDAAHLDFCNLTISSASTPAESASALPSRPCWPRPTPASEETAPWPRSPLHKRDEQRELTRRALIKWSVAAGAALGVSRAKVFDILERTGGKDIAFAAAENADDALGPHRRRQRRPRVVHAALAARRHRDGGATPSFAWHQAGQATLVQGTDKPLTIGPDTPWATLPGGAPGDRLPVRQQRDAHAPAAVGRSASTATTSSRSRARCSRRRRRSSRSITIGDVDVGTAPGSARPANVGDGDGIVGLFNCGGVARRRPAVERRATRRSTRRTTTRSRSSTARRTARRRRSRTRPRRVRRSFLGTNLVGEAADRAGGPRRATGSTATRARTSPRSAAR